MSLLALQGALLFAFIPLVLWLYLRLPFGPVLSLALGVGIMLSHRFAAAPWMSRHARERCLWCGRASAQGPPDRSPGGGAPASGVDLLVEAGGSEHAMVACGERHADLTRRFFTFVQGLRVPIAAGIFAPLLLLLAGTLLLALGRPLLTLEANAMQFRVIVACTVAGTSVGYLLVHQPRPPLRCPFPLHNLFLLGIRNTLWVFRIVGAWWLALGVAALVGRAG